MLSLVACSLLERENNRYKDKDFVVVKNIDKFVDVVLDKERSAYFRSTISEQCGRGKYYYNGTVFIERPSSSSTDQVEVSLSSRVDLNSIKLVRIKERYYKLEDIKYIYNLYLTMCDSHVLVELK